MSFTQSMSLPFISEAFTCERWKMTTFSGLCEAISMALSSMGLYSMSRVTSMAPDAETTTFGFASSMRMASSWGAKPPNTTECTAPRRAQASMAMAASGIMGM